jgi:hypothetical protein
VTTSRSATADLALNNMIKKLPKTSIMNLRGRESKTQCEQGEL